MRYGKGEKVTPETPFERAVINDSMIFSEYGLPIDPRQMPAPEYQAHIAIIRGINEARQEESEETKREAEKAKQRT